MSHFENDKLIDDIMDREVKKPASLPSEWEIADIIYSLKDDKGQLPPDYMIAKAISKRIRG